MEDEDTMLRFLYDRVVWREAQHGYSPVKCRRCKRWDWVTHETTTSAPLCTRCHSARCSVRGCANVTTETGHAVGCKTRSFCPDHIYSCPCGE